MCRLGFVIAVALGVLVSSAVAEPYWIAYEGNDFPENEGWNRVFGDEHGPGHGGAERSIEDGELVLDGRRNPLIVDFYEIERSIDPDPGEEFIAQWRLFVSDLQGDDGDASVAIASDTRMLVGFVYTADRIRSVFEDEVSLPLTPETFHEFELRSPDMQTYRLWIDSECALEGRFEQLASSSHVAWGDGVQGVASLSRWDYFRFGVVPEPNVGVGVLVMGIILYSVKKRHSRTRR